MRDHKYLQYCLQEIEKKMNWGKSLSWKEPEFLQLSEIIFKKTEIAISPQTLKRLYGKIKYKTYHNPQRATKNAMAKFLDFADWIEFTTHFDEKISNDGQQEKQSLWKKKQFKTALLVLSVVVFFMLIIFYFFENNFSKDNNKTISFSFDIADSIAFVPYTVFVKYNIKKVPSDSIYLDFDFTHPITGPEIKKLDKQQSLNNFTYQIPGYYHISLQSDGRELAFNNVLVISESWDSYFLPEGRPKLWLDSQIPTSKREGYLYYSTEYLAKNEFDINPVFYVDHQLFKKFEIDGDNFEMKARFKNSKETGGITCYDFLTNIHCEKNLTYFALMETGCSGYSGIKVGDTEVTGINANLSTLTFDNETWNNLHVVVKENEVRVFLNNKLVFSGNYQGSNGKIVGLEYTFKGTGILDYIHLKDLSTQQEFFDDF